MAKRTFEIYRYDPDKDAAPRMQTYEIDIDSHERMLLDALDQKHRFELPPSKFSPAQGGP